MQDPEREGLNRGGRRRLFPADSELGEVVVERSEVLHVFGSAEGALFGGSG